MKVKLEMVRPHTGSMGFVPWTGEAQAHKNRLVVKAANLSAAHQFLCCGRLVTDTHAHQHTSPPPSL